MIMTDQDHDGSHIKARLFSGEPVELGSGLDHQLYPLLVPVTAQVSRFTCS